MFFTIGKFIIQSKKVLSQDTIHYNQQSINKHTIKLKLWLNSDYDYECVNIIVIDCP